MSCVYVVWELCASYVRVMCEICEGCLWVVYEFLWKLCVSWVRVVCELGESWVWVGCELCESCVWIGWELCVSWVRVGWELGESCGWVGWELGGSWVRVGCELCVSCLRVANWNYDLPIQYWDWMIVKWDSYETRTDEESTCWNTKKSDEVTLKVTIKLLKQPFVSAIIGVRVACELHAEHPSCVSVVFITYELPTWWVRSVHVAYGLIAGIRRELLNMFNIFELTLCVSAITCVFRAYTSL